MLTLHLNFEKKISTVFHSLEQSSLTRSFQVRFESKVTLKYLTEKTCLIFTPSIFKLNNLLGFNFFELKRMTFFLKKYNRLALVPTSGTHYQLLSSK